MLEFGFGFVGFWIRKEGKVGVLVTGSVLRHGGIEEEGQNYGEGTTATDGVDEFEHSQEPWEQSEI
jgi:hypothetical protein